MSESPFRVPGLERDNRGRIRVAKSIIQAELSKPSPSQEGKAVTTPSWESMVSGRLTGKYDLLPYESRTGVHCMCIARH